MECLSVDRSEGSHESEALVPVDVLQVAPPD